MDSPNRKTPVSRFIVRHHRRFDVRYPATYTSASVQGQGLVVNISARGWKVTGDYQVQPGDTLRLVMTLSPHETPVRIERVSVLWVKGRDFGIRIEQVQATELLRLKAGIKTLASTR